MPEFSSGELTLTMKLLTEQHKARIGSSSKALWQDPEYRTKMLQKRREQGLKRRNRIDRTCQYCGKHFTIKASQVERGRGKFCSKVCQYKSMEIKVPWNKKPLVQRTCLECGRVFIVTATYKNQNFCSRECAYSYLKRKWREPAARRKKAEIIRELWQNSEYVTMMTTATHAKPNKLEQRLIDLFQQSLPQFKYNGDFSLGVSLGSLIPDFVNVNGKKEIIELYGDYWHSPEIIGDSWRRTELGRIMAYNSLGYKCLVLWGKELKKSTDVQIISKVNAFFGGRRSGSI